MAVAIEEIEELEENFDLDRKAKLSFIFRKGIFVPKYREMEVDPPKLADNGVNHLQNQFYIQLITLSHGEYSIGRNPRCDIYLEEDEENFFGVYNSYGYVHGIITVNSDRDKVEVIYRNTSDSNSAFWKFINGEYLPPEIFGKGMDRNLEVGDAIVLLERNPEIILRKK